MATYQEQLAKLAEEKARRDKGEAAMDRFCEVLADCLMPLIEAGTITQDQAAAVMTAIVRGSISAKLEGKL